MSCGKQDRQVAAVDDVPTEPPTSLDEPTKMRVQFRGAAGNVEDWYVGSLQNVEALFGGFQRHRFTTIGSGVDVAVTTGLVANFSEVNLKDLDLSRAKNGKSKLSQLVTKGRRSWDAAKHAKLFARRRKR